MAFISFGGPTKVYRDGLAWVFGGMAVVWVALSAIFVLSNEPGNLEWSIVTAFVAGWAMLVFRARIVVTADEVTVYHWLGSTTRVQIQDIQSVEFEPMSGGWGALWDGANLWIQLADGVRVNAKPLVGSGKPPFDGYLKRARENILTRMYKLRTLHDDHP